VSGSNLGYCFFVGFRRLISTAAAVHQIEWYFTCRFTIFNLFIQYRKFGQGCFWDRDSVILGCQDELSEDRDGKRWRDFMARLTGLDLLWRMMYFVGTTALKIAFFAWK
jgi:hypothetical protein